MGHIEISVSGGSLQAGHIVSGSGNIVAHGNVRAAIDPDLAAQLTALYTQLEAMSASHPREAKAVQEAADKVAATAGDSSVDKGRFSVSLAGLKEAAEAVRSIAPAVFEVVRGILRMLTP